MTKIKFELPADDMERVVAFYKAAFGWSAMQLPFNYALLDTDGKPVDPMNSAGGITPRNEFVKSPVLIIPVDSVDEASQKVKGAGGELLNEKQQVGNFGYSMYVKDTEGTVLCLWEDIKTEVS